MQYLATFLIYAAVFARALGWSQDSPPIPTSVWILLVGFGVVMLAEKIVSLRWQSKPRLYILVQAVLVTAMLYSAPHVDIFPMLFFPLSFQAVTFLGKRLGFACIATFILAMAGMLLFGLEWQAGLTMVLAGGAANLLMGGLAHLITRTDQRRQSNQRMLVDLKNAYRQLKAASSQAQALAAAEERHRLVRELHDSLTQTLFSMTLAVEAAQLAAQASPTAVDEHLSRLQALSRSAVREVQSLTGQSAAPPLAGHGLVAALRMLADERKAQDGLAVDLQVQGESRLGEAVESALFRITQEALNNVVRHSGVDSARVRLNLAERPAWLEIEDAGRGFLVQAERRPGGYGLQGMLERAAEIGWEVQVYSAPAQGTRVRAEERLP